MSWVQKKNINIENVNILLQESFEKNHFTNYGPLVKKLEQLFFENLQLDSSRCVIATNNGAGALHALVEGIRLYQNNPIKFTTQDFTFPCSLQGPLIKSKIVDIDQNYQFDLNQFMKDNSTCNSKSGIIVTNLFGNCCEINDYVNYCSANDKILIFDNATCPFTFYKSKNINNYGDGCIVSLHHTKPIGFGEGGLIICDKIYEESVRSILNFGYKDQGVRIWNPRGSNYKMSDISAAYIYDFQSNFNSILEYNKNLYNKFSKEIIKNNKLKLFPHFGDENPFVSCIPIIYKGNALLKIRILNDNKIEARQYYPPLFRLPNSVLLYNSIICVPCNNTVTDEIFEKIIEILLEDDI